MFENIVNSPEALGAIIIPILMAIGNLYKTSVTSQRATKLTPIVIFLCSLLILWLLDKGFIVGMNVYQIALYSILFTLVAVGAYEIAKRGVGISQTKTP